MLKQQPFCSQEFHEREVSRCFCIECQVCICQICLATNHQNHKVDRLGKAALEEKDNIMCGAKMIRNKESEICEVIKQCEETISKLESNVATAKRKVSRVAEEIIAENRERKGEASDSLEATIIILIQSMVTKQIIVNRHWQLWDWRWRCVSRLFKNNDKFDNRDYPENTPCLTRQTKGLIENIKMKLHYPYNWIRCYKK